MKLIESDYVDNSLIHRNTFSEELENINNRFVFTEICLF
jgi:hypothetical protein